MLWGRCLIFNIIFGGMIIALANKSITTRDITLSSVSVMISSPDNKYYQDPLVEILWK